jgi:pimeloyl-ACP methyl ester carboxylesterase
LWYVLCLEELHRLFNRPFWSVADMMPFSVLRIWGLGLFSWSLLAVGIYLGYRAYEEFKRPDTRLVNASDDLLPGEDETANDAQTVVRQPVRRADDWHRWAFLAGAILCFSVSLGGYWPVSFLLGHSESKEPRKIEPISVKHLDRPDGSRLHIEVFGRANGPALLLTHGWSLDISAWDYIRAELAERYRVITWDLPGMGKSQGPTNGDYSLEKMARDLEAVLQATSAKSPVLLVGHSIGGMIQQTFCRLFHDQLGGAVAAIALVHTTYTNPLRTNVASSLTTALETPVIIPLNYLTIALAPIAWLSNWQSYLNGSLHLFTRFASFSGKQSRQQVDHGARLAAAAWPSAVARGNLAMLSFNEERILPQIEVPTLLIAADHDRMTLPSATARLENELPNAGPTSVDGGHLGHWERGDHVAQILLEFADQVFASSGSNVIAESRAAADKTAW